MAFKIITDTGSNLPKSTLTQMDVTVIPFTYWMQGVPQECPVYPEDFDSHAYYDKLRAGVDVKTSLINSDKFTSYFRPVLEAGQDVLYIGMSTAISGTCQSAALAAEALMEEFPDRKVQVLSSLGSGCGTGLLVCRAWDAYQAGRTLEETYQGLLKDRDRLCEYFTVDDLMFLKRGGRVSAAVALVGSMLQIKPILYGNNEGKIVITGKARGRKRAIDALAELYRKKVRLPEHSRIFISHGDCLEEAQTLAKMIEKIAPPRELTVTVHEPLTGAHVGPGMLAVFFLGDSR